MPCPKAKTINQTTTITLFEFFDGFFGGLVQSSENRFILGMPGTLKLHHAFHNTRLTVFEKYSIDFWP